VHGLEGFRKTSAEFLSKVGKLYHLMRTSIGAKRSFEGIARIRYCFASVASAKVAHP